MLVRIAVRTICLYKKPILNYLPMAAQYDYCRNGGVRREPTAAARHDGSLARVSLAGLAYKGGLMKKVGVVFLIMMGVSPLVSGWTASNCEDMECKKLEMCEEERAITQKLLNDRKAQCDSSGGVACQNYERSMNNAETKRLLEKPCAVLLREGYNPLKR